MRVLLLLFFFALPGVASAQKVYIPRPPVVVAPGNLPDSVNPLGASSDHKPELCTNSIGTLLEVLRELTNDASVDAELKFEKDKQLDDKQIYDHRMEIIKRIIKTLRGPKVSQ